ncbi:uncharacterized protein LOC129889090 [Solanum dulcamara]|uniref:uncharacterized protein LOC129889090 n=1 Tax=Solanum dulcamara TaxID=45834 RepID=UPI002485BEE2|nr:uncharacterized protein LOC129889090 [Solanum dulcamara]
MFTSHNTQKLQQHAAYKDKLQVHNGPGEPQHSVCCAGVLEVLFFLFFYLCRYNTQLQSPRIITSAYNHSLEHKATSRQTYNRWATAAATAVATGLFYFADAGITKCMVALVDAANSYHATTRATALLDSVQAYKNPPISKAPSVKPPGSSSTHQHSLWESNLGGHCSCLCGCLFEYAGC